MPSGSTSAAQISGDWSAEGGVWTIGAPHSFRRTHTRTSFALRWPRLRRRFVDVVARPWQGLQPLVGNRLARELAQAVSPVVQLRQRAFDVGEKGALLGGQLRPLVDGGFAQRHIAEIARFPEGRRLVQVGDGANQLVPLPEESLADLRELRVGERVGFWA